MASSRGFSWTQMSPVSVGIPYEKLQGEITTGQIGSRMRQSPLRGVTSKEPVMDLHGEGTWCLVAGWEKQLGLRIWRFTTILGSLLRPDMLLRIIEHIWVYDLKSVNLFSLIQTHNPWSFKSQLSSFAHHILCYCGLVLSHLESGMLRTCMLCLVVYMASRWVVGYCVCVCLVWRFQFQCGLPGGISTKASHTEIFSLGHYISPTTNYS